MQNLLSTIRRNLGVGGGVGVKLEIPTDFTWNDRAIPLTVTLTGHKSKLREIEELRFSFRDDDHNGDSSHRGENVKHHWSPNEQVLLAARDVRSMKLQMPLPFGPDTLEALECGIAEQDSAAGRFLAGVMRGGLKPAHRN